VKDHESNYKEIDRAVVKDADVVVRATRLLDLVPRSSAGDREEVTDTVERLTAAAPPSR
jgi:hypothetical protein